ncbi:MAG: hypothetical protein WA364_16380 [Candidatus Nitrosopolaris sp.]
MTAQANEEIKAQEDEKFKAIEQKYDADITRDMREILENMMRI